MALGIAALALSFAGSIQAQGTSTNSAPPLGSKPRPQKHQYTGDIASIDSKAGTVIVKKGEADSKTFKIDDKTKYSTAAKKDAAIADIKVGDKVVVHYTEEDGVLTAHHIGPPPAPKPAQ
jgi:Cu/Ag efflux protein CusF